jgi:hypothetical protein
MAIEYTNFFHYKALQNLPKFGFSVRKQNIWQPWSLSDRVMKKHNVKDPGFAPPSAVF